MELIVHRVHVVMAIVGTSLLFTIYAYDPNPLQNFCVADNKASVHVNGKVCKDSKLVTADDFLYSGLQIAVNANNSLGFNANVVDVNKLPGLNTLGLTTARADFEPNGVSPPHIHPRASEISIVLEGTIYFGFVDSMPGTKSRVFSKILKRGDVFTNPIGLIHFAKNVGSTSAISISAFNSQNPGFITVPTDVFGTEPSIPRDLLAKAFQLDNKTIEHLQSVW